MIQSAVLVFLLFAAPLRAQGEDPNSVSVNIQTVEATGRHRLIVFRECSPEHCWSRSYLQWFDTDADDLKVKVTKEVSELGYGTFVTSALWVWVGEKPHLEVKVSASHGGFEPYTLVVEPGEPGVYAATRRK